MNDRHGAKQPERFNPSRAARLDDPQRLSYLPPKELLELLDPPRDAQVLDFGTGTGMYAIAVARLRPDVHVIALDEQPEMLALLQEKLLRDPLRNVQPLLGDGVVDPVGHVLAINVLHELGDAALAHLRDSITRSGRILFADWNADVDRPVGPPREHVYTPEEARTRLAAAGFNVLNERMFPYHYAMLVAARDYST